MTRNYTNRWIYPVVFINILCFTESCSLQRLLPFRRKAVPRVVADTAAKAASTEKTVIKYAVYPQPDTFGLSKPAKEETSNGLIARLQPVFEKRKIYTTFNVKAKAHFEGPGEQQDFTAFIRVKKDSAVWINIFGLGGVVNAVRIYVTPDSFFMINYLQREVTKLSLNDVAKVLPSKIDFASLQNLIVGDPVRNGEIKDVAELTNSWLLRVEDSSYVQNINYTKADSTMSMCQFDTRDPNGPHALLKYEKYEPLEGQKMSVSRNISIKNGADLFSIDLYYINAAFNNPLEMPFNIPASYSVKQ